MAINAGAKAPVAAVEEATGSSVAVVSEAVLAAAEPIR